MTAEPMLAAAPFSAILVAAGRGERMGGDKLWIDLWGRPVWQWSLDALLATRGLVDVAVVVGAQAVDRHLDAIDVGARKRCFVVPGGATRADSVIAGLRALTRAGHDDETIVLVHDAARPAVTPDLVARVASAVASGSAAIVPVIPLPDSLKRVRDDTVVAAVERDEVVAAQTPQGARLGELRAGIEEAHASGRPITDDAGALAVTGVRVLTVRGDPRNRKLTEPADLDAIRAALGAAASPLTAAATGQATGVRVGIGFDAHRLVAGRPMRLGGVSFPEETAGPQGHSDGDALLHALVDALLGAVAAGDIGSTVPADDRTAGANSATFVREAVARVRAMGWLPRAADVAVAAARPAIAPRRHELATSIGSLLGLSADAIGVKGTTTDGLGIVADGGIAAWAVAVLERIPAAEEPAAG